MEPSEAKISPWTGKPLVGVSGEYLQIQGTAEVTMQLANQCFPIRFVVVNDLTSLDLIFWKQATVP